MPHTQNQSSSSQHKALKGVRVLSLALNLPGPAALMRCREMGARCVKLEPPAPAGAATGTSGDPMSHYNPVAYAAMHEGIRTTSADLKSDKGQKALHRELAKADVLVTSFRPSALAKLGLGWKALHKQYPRLGMIAIVGAPGTRAEEAGHDLTYQAEYDLVTGLTLPPTLYADMGGALMASEAVLQAVMQQRLNGKGIYLEVALSEAAGFLALPRTWGLTKPGAPVGGGHAGYQVYKCRDGRVAVAALEPHFARRLCQAAGIHDAGGKAMFTKATAASISAWMATKTRTELDRLAMDKDIPMHTLPA
ncbi:MAG: CoA transferase [Pseudomonadota bacterium]